MARPTVNLACAVVGCGHVARNWRHSSKADMATDPFASERHTFVEPAPQAPTCTETACRHYGQRHATAHEPRGAGGVQGETKRALKCNHAAGVCVGHTVENGAKEWIMDDRPIEDEPVAVQASPGTRAAVAHLTRGLPRPAQPDPDAVVRVIADSWMPAGKRLAADWPGRLTECVREAFAAGLAQGLSSATVAIAELEKELATAKVAGARKEREAFVNGLTCDDSESVFTGGCGHTLCGDVLAIARRGNESKEDRGGDAWKPTCAEHIDVDCESECIGRIRCSRECGVGDATSAERHRWGCTKASALRARSGKGGA